MKVLLLSPYPEMLHPALDAAGDDAYDFKCIEWLGDWDWVICFGYNNIIKEPFLAAYKNRIINIHISFLPWNRGADPNFWSWFDNTPKGVTVHRIDAGIDTGNILVQQEVTRWRKGETLSSSWHALMVHAKKLFEDNWINIRRDGLPTRKANGNGSYHRSADKTQWFRRFPLGWDTPVKDIIKLGKAHRATEVEKKDRHPRPRKYRQQTFKEL